MRWIRPSLQMLLVAGLNWNVCSTWFITYGKSKNHIVVWNSNIIIYFPHHINGETICSSWTVEFEVGFLPSFQLHSNLSNWLYNFTYSSDKPSVYLYNFHHISIFYSGTILGPVVQKLINANLGLKVNQGFNTLV